MPPAPSRSSPWTSATWTWTTSVHGYAQRAASSTSCTGRAPPGCSRASSMAAPPGRCSSPTAGPPRHALPPFVDTCPIAGRGQLSYQHAGYLFKQPSLRVIADGRPGWSLHGLRHAALTHLGSNGCTAVELQAKSRHAPLRTLMRPSPTWSAPRAAPSWPIHPRPLSGGPAVDGRRGPVRPTLPPCLPYPAGVWPVQISAARKSGSAVARLPRALQLWWAAAPVFVIVACSCPALSQGATPGGAC